LGFDSKSINIDILEIENIASNRPLGKAS